MLEQLYGWIQNIAAYLILVSAVMQAVPGKEYKKYIQFFSGLVLILLLFTPVLKLTGMETTFTELYHNREYEREKQEIEEKAKYFEDLDIMEFVPEEYQGHIDEGADSQIEVEDIEIAE